ncbi:MAG: hypothetical protein WC854_12780 [Bacteroidales bacterium]
MKEGIFRLVKFVLFVLLTDYTLVPHIVSAQNVITEAPEHFNKFNNVNGGWCAADGTISLLLPDGKTLWLFGDCFIGEKNGEFGINPLKSKMINNAAILEESSILTAYYGGSFENPSSFIPGDGQDFFWPEHAIIENDTLKIFSVRVMYKDNGTPGFNFQVGTSYIASYKYPNIEYINTSKTKYITDSTMRFGTCILKSANYTYIFGLKDTSSGSMKWSIPYLARVTQSVDEPWQFYAGSDSWSYNCKEAKPVGDRPMSESFFVYEKNNKFYLIMHEIWTVGELYIMEADKITGPWNRSSTGGTETRFAIIKPHTNNFSYNLFAHPQFQNGEKILISFNVNTNDFNSIYSDTRNYRARFFWLSVDEAVRTSIPDTISLFDVPSSIPENKEFGSDSKLSFNQLSNELNVKDIFRPTILRILGIDGKQYLNLKISHETTINCSNLPKTILIIQLIQNERSVETLKVFNL